MCDPKERRVNIMTLFPKTMTNEFYSYCPDRYDTKTVYKERPKRERLPYKPVKNVEICQKYKDKPVPFHLFIKKNPILHINPQEIKLPTAPPKRQDDIRHVVRRTRPRVTIGSQKQFDAIESDEAYDLIVKDTYTSTQKNCIDFTAKDRPSKAPLIGKYSPSLPLKLPRHQPHYVSPEWRMQSLDWDRRQLRTMTPESEDFWFKFGETQERERNDPIFGFKYKFHSPKH